MQWYVRGLNYTLYIRWKFQKFKWSCPWSWMTHDAKHDTMGSVLGTILWYKEFDWILYAEHHLQVCNFSLQWFPRFDLNEADLKGWIISFCIAPTVFFIFLFLFLIYIIFNLSECEFLTAHLLNFAVQKRSTYRSEVLRVREIRSRGFTLDSPEPSSGSSSVLSSTSTSSSDSSSPDACTKTHVTPNPIHTKFRVQPTTVPVT